MASEALSKLFGGLAVSLRPPEQLSYSEWAAKNFRLSADTTASPGRFQPWKFQRGILDAIGDETLTRVTVVKSARVGFTVSLVASLGAIALNDPSPIILLLPTDDDARGIMVDDIDPHFRASPALQGAMRVGRFDGRNTLTQRSLRGGGSLKVLSAVAPRKLRRHTARVLFCDEVDGMEITKEGDPIKLAEMRTLSFANRKIVIGSTPTLEETSLIIKRYRESDQRIFECPCPHCDTPFELQWEHMDWTPGKPETVVCICPECGTEIEEKFKAEMHEKGNWRITQPEVKGHAGFRINTLISLFANASWPNLVAEYEKAQKAGSADMQVFHNTVLGRGWSTAVEYVSETELFARREPFGIEWMDGESRWREEIPAEVGYITAGCDVQYNRVEITFVGHSPDHEFFLGHHKIFGDVRLKTVWDEVYSVLMTRWKHPLGGEIGVEASAIDSSDGNMTQVVYEFCEAHQGEKIFAIKGREGNIRELDISGSNRRNFRAPLYIVGVDTMKTYIVTGLPKQPSEINSFRFSNSLSEEWFEQFTSEKRVIKYKHGRPEVTFEGVGRRRHEAIDCAVYGLAIRRTVRFDFAKRYEELKKPSTAQGGRKSLRDLGAALNR